MCRIMTIIVAGVLGMAGCHGDTHLSTDVNADLLRTSAVSTMAPVAVQGNVACSTCVASNGMAIVVTSVMTGNVAHALLNGIGSYAVSGTAKVGDTLTITVTVTKESGAITQSAKAAVPDGGGTITQNFQF